MALLAALEGRGLLGASFWVPLSPPLSPLDPGAGFCPLFAAFGLLTKAAGRLLLGGAFWALLGLLGVLLVLLGGGGRLLGPGGFWPTVMSMALVPVRGV